jgi:hypothetical protein
MSASDTRNCGMGGLGPLPAGGDLPPIPIDDDTSEWVNNDIPVELSDRVPNPHYEVPTRDPHAWWPDDDATEIRPPRRPMPTPGGAGK